MMLAPGDDFDEIVARGNGGASQPQHLGKRIDHPPGLAIVPELGKMLQEWRQTRPRIIFDGEKVRHVVYAAFVKRNRVPTESHRRVEPKSPFSVTSVP